MDREEWEVRWREKRIGFHQGDVNPYLVRHAARFPAKGRVLVPLCGKSRDMTWLRDRGFEVVGAEFVEDACVAYFEEQAIPYRRDGKKFSGGGVTIWNDDFFALDPSLVGTFDWVFDRAALIALAPGDQVRYAEQVLRFLEPGKSMLLVAAFYDTTKTGPPPFAVTPEEVQWLFSSSELDKLEERDVIEENARFRERGLEWLIEHVWIVTRRTHPA